MKTGNLAAVVIAIGLGLVLTNLNWAQDPSPRATPEVKEQQLRELKIAVEAQQKAVEVSAKAAAKAMAAAHSDAIRVRQLMPVQFGQPRHLTQIQGAAEAYRDAKDGADKERELHRLRDLASKFFEEDMEIRKRELADIETRLEKLRAQLERRRAKKDEIVDLQVRVAINEADGLGFTSTPRDNVKFDVRVANPFMVLPDAPKFDVVTAVPPAADMIPPPPPVKVGTRILPAELHADPMAFGVGAKGDAIRLLQKALNERLEPSPELNIDGDFGPQTESAVREFQSENDLEETGVVDQATREKLELPAELPPFLKP